MPKKSKPKFLIGPKERFYTVVRPNLNKKDFTEVKKEPPIKTSQINQVGFENTGGFDKRWVTKDETRKGALKDLGNILVGEALKFGADYILIDHDVINEGERYSIHVKYKFFVDTTK